MNCPYCDETIHAMAKFCPKCGLPLKDDATVMGAYVRDGDGPNWTIIGGGAAAIIVIALAIGFIGSRKDSANPDTVRRDLVAQPVSAPMASNTFGVRNFNQFSPVGSPAGGSPMRDEKPRWAYTPPTAAPAPQAVALPDNEAAVPPSQILRMNPMAMAHQPAPLYAMAVRPAIPETPSLPADVPPNVPPSEDLSSGVVLDNNPPPPPIEDPTGLFVYDPVQGRYAINPERHPRRSNTATGNRRPAGFVPGNVPVDNVQTPTSTVNQTPR
jgi:hypothetical protein